jgi:hypothetical protein
MRRSLRSVRTGSAAVAGACAVLACGASPAGAQLWPRLHITALGMHADRAAVAVGDTYHITIHVHITQRRDRLDELVLPSLTNAIDLGDERRRVPGTGGGTDFYEIMTVSSPEAGEASFTPAYIDAIDPAVGRPLRYSSQPVTVRVAPSGASPEAIDTVTQSVEQTLHDALLYGGLALAAIVIPLVFVLRRPRAPVAPLDDGPLPVARPVVAPVDPLREAIATFRSRGDDASLDALRNLLFMRAGARTGATLTDALAAVGTRDPALAHAMAIAERVRFGPRAERAAATADLFEALDVLLLTGPVRA